MHIVHYSGSTLDMPPLVATVGFFDGVHAGHRFLIKQVQEVAEEKRLSSAVVTFREHPRKALMPSAPVQLLTTFEERMKLIAQTGVDYCIVIDFSVAFSRLSAKHFLQDVLFAQSNVRTLFVGYDHRLGHNRAEGYYQYKSYGEEVGLELVQAVEFEPSMHISSSHIRKLLDCGEVERASKLLSYNYQLFGTVEEGFKIGRTIGYPTANVVVLDNEKIVPSNGIYAVKVFLDSEHSPKGGMLYIGNRPTLHSDGKRSIEVNIFDFNSNLYSKTIGLEFISFVRGDHHFASIVELTEQIAKDKERVLAILHQKT